MGRRISRAIAIPLSVSGDKLPTEVRLFAAGWNETSKGEFLFDDAAAESVMAAFERHGVDVQIDLEHLSVAAAEVSGDGRNFDPDARGWCRLELRDGALWAVGISWTPDGTQRLRERRQRYFSPAFETDDNERIVEIYNIAMTANPATHDAVPLVASRRRRSEMNRKQLLKQLVSLSKQGKSATDIMQTLSITVDQLKDVAAAMDVDPEADVGQIIAAVVEFAEELTGGGEPAEPEGEELADDEPEDEKDDEDENLKELRRLQKRQAKIDGELALLKAERDKREQAERHELVVALVKLGRETPATAWANSDGQTPRGSLASMPLDELRARVDEFTRLGAITPGRAPAPKKETAVASVDGVQVSEYEQSRVRVASARSHVDADAAIARYADHKRQQIKGARSRETADRLSRPLEQEHCLAGSHGRFGDYELTLLGNPVKPIEQFHGSSQRALEEFRVEFLSVLSSQPQVWAETFGAMLPGGSLRDTYPIEIEAVEYREKNAQNAAATTPQSFDVTVDKREFRAAKTAQLRRIQQGDFAYVQSWQKSAQTMALARVHLRNELVAALLDDGNTGFWAQSAEYPTGIDGQPYFSATHAVNPFDDKFTFHGAATWGNYNNAGTPLDPSVLTTEKNSMLFVPAPNGREVGGFASHVLVPSGLYETARLMLTVQDLILAPDEQGAGPSGKFGTVRNEHFNSGFLSVWAPELPGAGVTADFYLLSQERIARGMVPWVVAEDAAEELLSWDESSDFYKDSGLIKLESKIYCNAVLLYPYAIRRVNGT